MISTCGPGAGVGGPTGVGVGASTKGVGVDVGVLGGIVEVGALVKVAVVTAVGVSLGDTVVEVHAGVDDGGDVGMRAVAVTVGVGSGVGVRVGGSGVAVAVRVGVPLRAMVGVGAAGVNVGVGVQGKHEPAALEVMNMRTIAAKNGAATPGHSLLLANSAPFVEAERATNVSRWPAVTLCAALACLSRLQLRAGMRV